jgi:hypothetical protein
MNARLILIVGLLAAFILPAQAETPWTSLVVRHDGTFDLHEGIKSEKSCRESLCYVQWNVSCASHVEQVAEQKRKDELAAIEQQKRELLYRQDHPCKIEKDGSKTCPTSICSSENFDKDGKSTGMSTVCFGSMTMSPVYGMDRSISVVACFQAK